jgi:uncharacterized protein (TIGR03000 family)
MYSHLFPAAVTAAALGLLLVVPSPSLAGGRRATIQVRLPADARLTIDGSATRSKSALRRFITPPLEPGKAFHYTFKAEWVRGRKTITVERRVTVRAGRETFLSLWPERAYGAAGRNSAGYYGAYPRSAPSNSSRSVTETYYPSPGPTYFNFNRYGDSFQWAPEYR